MNSGLTGSFMSDGISAGVFVLPDGISERFDVLELMAENDHGETYLLGEISSGKKYVLKCRSKAGNTIDDREPEILRGLSHPGLPAFTEALEQDGKIYIIREYAQGIPLNQYVKNAGSKLDAAEAAGIAMRLCDILAYLHSQQSPVIHRDVKPSNIIIDADNDSVTLIDFGIARRYSKDADSDTAYYGTKGFSPPEQFGYAQTDSRTDIYALGVVLRYMLTGSPIGQVEDKRLEKVISKCTAFSPDDRYRNAAALKKDLSKCGSGRQIYIIKTAAAAALIFALLAAGVYSAYASGLFDAINQKQDAYVIFAEPFIEEVVRHKLGKDEAEPILPGELGTVTQLILYEADLIKHFYGDAAPRFTILQEEKNGRPYDIYFGTLSSLEDIPLLYNLDELFLMAQPVTDLSPLAACGKLRRVEIYSAPVTDASPLARLTHIQFLCISDLGINDYSFLSEMESLRTLWLENLPLRDISEIEAYGILDLSIQNTKITNLEGIEQFKHLEALDISNTGITDFSLLDAVPGLKNLTMTENMLQYLHTLSRSDVEIVWW